MSREIKNDQLRPEQIVAIVKPVIRRLIERLDIVPIYVEDIPIPGDIFNLVSYTAPFDPFWVTATIVGDPSGPGTTVSIQVSAQSIGFLIDANSFLTTNATTFAAGDRIYGRLSTPGVGQELTGAQVNTILPVFTNVLNGLAPFSGGGTTNFLRADGTWAAPGGGSGDNITVNTVAATDADFDDATPAAPGGDLNVKWQKDAGTPNNISAYVDVSVLEPLIAIANITGTLAIGKGGTGQTTAVTAFNALSPVTTAGDLIYRDGTNNVRLAIGGVGQVLRTNAAVTAPQWAYVGTTVYAPTPGDTAVNVVADATIATVDIPNVAAGEQLEIEAEFTILNNSGATRVYVITADFDNAFDVEFSTGALTASATNAGVFFVKGVLNIRSTSLAYAAFKIESATATAQASGADVTMAATNLNAFSWGTTASDLTGTLTCNLKVRSANATATQTLRLISFRVKRVTPT